MEKDYKKDTDEQAPNADRVRETLPNIAEHTIIIWRELQNTIFMGGKYTKRSKDLC